MKWLALLLIRIYQGVHLAFFRNCCRFHPTCSEYATQAIEAHGLVRGVLLGSWRILRCQPFAKGGWDPVPPKSSRPHPTEPAPSLLPPASTRRPLAGSFRLRRNPKVQDKQPLGVTLE